jgi:hypothetical protein
VTWQVASTTGACAAAPQSFHEMWLSLYVAESLFLVQHVGGCAKVPFIAAHTRHVKGPDVTVTTIVICDRLFPVLLL